MQVACDEDGEEQRHLTFAKLCTSRFQDKLTHASTYDLKWKNEATVIEMYLERVLPRIAVPARPDSDDDLRRVFGVDLSVSDTLQCFYAFRCLCLNVAMLY